MTLELCGWIGAVLLAGCGIPLALDAFFKKSCTTPTSFLAVWGAGEVFTLIYVIPTGSLPLIFNYFCNIMLIGVCVYYKFWGEEE